jgi:hypothetical protein
VGGGGGENTQGLSVGSPGKTSLKTTERLVVTRLHIVIPDD